MRQLDIEAKIENLDKVLAFVDEQLEDALCSMKVQMQVDVAVEEIFVNIAHYAYAPGTGDARIEMDINEDNKEMTIRFMDKGVQYDPLKKEDPDVTLSAEEREIGGLGIFMVKKSMDDVQYEYKDGQNILTLSKKL